MKDISPGTPKLLPAQPHGGRQHGLLLGERRHHGFELWKTDGTAQGTAMVKDAYAGVLGSYPQNLVNAGGTLFYKAFDPSGGYELWKSDGTAAGTAMVKDIYPGAHRLLPRDLTAAGARCSSPPMTASTARSCGRATARPPAPPGQGHQSRASQLLARRT